MRLKVKSCVGSISPLLALIGFVKTFTFQNKTNLIKWRHLSFCLLPLLLKFLRGVLYLCQAHLKKNYLFVLTFISVSLQSRSSRSSSSRKWLLFKTGATECQPNSGDLERPLFVAADWRNLPTNNGP